MFTQLLMWFLLIEVSFSTTAVTNYPTVDLLENVPINTLVLRLTQETRKHKLVLLNMSGFESNMFSVVNGSVYTTNVIDREQLVAEKRCLDRLSCTLELHVLVDDGLAYWVIPVHIVDENDNKPRFGKSEIHLKFRDNVVGGYKIPFSGAMDPDEDRNGQIRYVLDCSSSSFHRSRHFVDPFPSSIDCQSQFELVVLSQSSTLTFDQLALKFIPSSSISHRRNEYELVLYAIDNGRDGKQFQSSMRIRVTIERTEKAPVFTLSQYEFVSISSSITVGTILGRIHAIGSDASRPIHYKLVDPSPTTDGIEIGQFTGELVVSKEPPRDLDEVKLTVEAFHLSETSTPLTTRVKVKIFFRSFDRLNNVSYHFDIVSSDRQGIRRLDNSHSFLIDRDIQLGQSLIKISTIPHNYPSDIYILSLDTHAATFSLSSSSNNSSLLRTRRLLTSKAIYLLTIGVKHKLSQQWLPNLRLELIVIDQWMTSISTASTSVQRQLESTTTSPSICMENMTYVVRHLDNDEEIASLTVVETTNSTEFSSSSVLVLSSNRSEVTLDGCRMRVERFENRPSSNESLFRMCSARRCSNVTLVQQLSPLSIKMQNDLSSWLLPARPIEITMIALSIVFVLAAITLALVICRLNGVRLCLTIKNYVFYGKKYGLTNARHLSVAKVPERVQSIVVRESRSPSFEPIRTKDRHQDPYVFNIDQFLEHEPLPSNHVFTLPPVSSSSSLPRPRPVISMIDNETPRTSSSSFLQETKQLLEIVSSTNSDFDLMRLASEV